MSWGSYVPGRDNSINKNSDSRNNLTSTGSCKQLGRKGKQHRQGQVAVNLQHQAKELRLSPVEYGKPSKGFEQRLAWLDDTLVQILTFPVQSELEDGGGQGSKPGDMKSSQEPTEKLQTMRDEEIKECRSKEVGPGMSHWKGKKRTRLKSDFQLSEGLAE